MPIDRRDLIFLSQIPFQLSGEEDLSPRDWCFYLSFNWAIHKEIPPSLAQRILTLALKENILEKKNETLTLKETSQFPPLHKPKIDHEDFKDIEQYPIELRIEYSSVDYQPRLDQQKRESEKMKACPSETVGDVEKKGKIQREKEDKKKQESKEEKPEKKTKTTKKQKSTEEKPELTLDHFTKS